MKTSAKHSGLAVGP